MRARPPSTGAAGPAPPAFEAHAFTMAHPRTGERERRGGGDGWEGGNVDLDARPDPARPLLPSSLGAPTQFLLTPDAHALLEVNAHAPAHAAWLAGDAVAGDGRVILATPVDPLLLALPRLAAARAATGSFVTPEDAVAGAGDEAGGRLLAALAAAGRGSAGAALAPACEAKDVGGETYYRLCDDRALAWLRLKAATAGNALRGAGGAAASLDDAAATAAGAALLAEYLPRPFAAALGVADASDRAAPDRWSGAPAGDAPSPAAKRVRVDPKEIARVKAAAAREEARAAAKKKEASSMKSLASFFAPKRPAA